MEIKEYKHQDNKMFVYVDLPGVNTPEFRKEDYLEKVEFNSYDCYIIICRERFSQDDEWFAEQVKKRKKNFYFVRTKVKGEKNIQNLQF